MHVGVSLKHAMKTFSGTKESVAASVPPRSAKLNSTTIFCLEAVPYSTVVSSNHQADSASLFGYEFPPSSGGDVGGFPPSSGGDVGGFGGLPGGNSGSVGSSDVDSNDEDAQNNLLGHDTDTGGITGDGGIGGHVIMFNFPQVSSEAEQIVIDGGTSFGGSGGISVF